MQDSPRILLSQALSCPPVRGQGPYLHFTKHSQVTMTCVQVRELTRKKHNCVWMRTGRNGTV